MSLSLGGQWLTCDGDDCTERTRVPVVLRTTLRDDGGLPMTSGWLYVTRGGVTRHYCPRCRSIYLGRMDALTSRHTLNHANPSSIASTNNPGDTDT
jgi:hypothetical protein